ncbi:MAG TPA: FAD-dependent monooxygenase [Pseudonocardiaceae bacterium]|jgi:2-polyprenyl-6-methoxyphenol hydroxylase-like FAD-dependent oxidoreductase|nr:FAD-dependent monooxygenase [Pseudonocardiaceae bacterium]
MLLVLVSWEADVMQVDTAVIVVGAGPTGLMLAGELALAGVAVEVLEKQTAPSGQSRGGGVNPRSAEVLATRGLIDAVTDRAIPRENTGGHFAHLPVALDTRPWRTRYPGGLLIPQNRLEQVLEDHLAGLGVTVRRGTELTGLDTASDEGVTAAVRGPGGRYRLRGRYLVACDGGHSTVRKLTGVAFPGRAGTLAAVSADIELTSRSATVPRSVDHISQLTCTGGGYWMLLHPLDHPAEDSGLYRVVFGGPEQAHLPRAAPVSPGEVTRALAAVHGTQTQLGRLRWGTRFSDASRQVADYRVGRVIFAGDAAHIHSPIGGQGLNLGLQDAVNLGWKLAAYAHGSAPDGLLDSYHTERHPVAARVIATARAQTVLMNPPPDADDLLALRAIVGDLARLPDANRYLAGLMSGLDICYDLGDPDPDPLLGARMPDLDLRTTQGITTRISTLLRTGRGLLLQLGDTGATVPLPAGVDRLAARSVSPTGSHADHPAIGKDTGAATDVHTVPVLIRPDGYVCWVGATPEASPAAALKRWFGAAPVAAR